MASSKVILWKSVSNIISQGTNIKTDTRNIHTHTHAHTHKYPAIFNISRTGRVALMLLGSQSEETLLFIREKSLSRGASKSEVRRR
jgi:hypothetical protein